MHVDGWLCEIKDVQIRDGLHVLGAGADRGRADQPRAGRAAVEPGVRRPGQRRAGAAFGVGPRRGRTDRRGGPDRGAKPRVWSAALAGSGWDPTVCPGLTDNVGAQAALRFAAVEVVPRLRRTTDEITATLHALAGGYVPAGPSGSPLRGLVNVLPTGRNFYSVDPKAIPSRLAFQTGQSMADSLLRRHLDDTGEYPRSVGLSVWGTSAMRTSGDDIAEVLALLGVLPVWDDASRRVVGLEAVGLDELARPRIDVTVRISGFFRDAFPHVVAMIDDAVRLVAERDEPLDSTTSGPTPRPTWPSTVISGGPPPGSSGRSPARTGPASCR